MDLSKPKFPKTYMTTNLADIRKRTMR